MSGQPSAGIPKPDLLAWLMSTLADQMALVNCISHGTVQAFDATKQTATVSINYLRVIKNANPNLPNPSPNDQTSDITLPYPLLVNVPIICLGGGGAYLTFPIAKGDFALIFFNDREIDTWFTTGQITAPQKLRTHDLSDGWALVGVRNMINLIQNYNASVASLTDQTGERLSQAGDLKATARSSAPSGWLLCYGQAVSRTTYSVLFAAIGTTWGSGDGSTTFNVPDFRGRIPVGLDNMGGTDANRLLETQNSFTTNRNTLGGSVGQAAHTQTVAELVSHTHGISDESGAQGGSPQWGAIPSGPVQSTATGGGLAFNVVQPGLMTNWCIKY